MLELADIKRQLRSFCRRNRTALKYTHIGQYTAEEVSDMLIDCVGAEEVKKILHDIDIINQRGGNTVKYFMLILEGLKAA
ncbi:hypothetical protein CN378_11105 [Bacillus sp. AFS015802]|uniref:hypothetical protein n=1 Tax=Bacillus sp. AFS015802 TaxID=2033486 RepID=UPI000BF56F67|nr:hypothetical protein [Bacillus sp. AFS015802]PFA67386.1 hypothetical protein CN378_11105 [Bacillus sp. AFS015802]